MDSIKMEAEAKSGMNSALRAADFAGLSGLYRIVPHCTALRERMVIFEF